MTLLDGFSLQWIRDCGKIYNSGRYKAGVDKTGICSVGEMGLVSEASAAKYPVDSKGFKLSSFLSRRRRVGWGNRR